MYLLRLLLLDCEPVLRRPIETTRITGMWLFAAGHSLVSGRRNQQEFAGVYVSGSVILGQFLGAGSK
jgi:hypothetical protein